MGCGCKRRLKAMWALQRGCGGRRDVKALVTVQAGHCELSSFSFFLFPCDGTGATESFTHTILLLHPFLAARQGEGGSSYPCPLYAVLNISPPGMAKNEGRWAEFSLFLAGTGHVSSLLSLALSQTHPSSPCLMPALTSTSVLMEGNFMVFPP